MCARRLVGDFIDQYSGDLSRITIFKEIISAHLTAHGRYEKCFSSKPFVKRSSNTDDSLLKTLKEQLASVEKQEAAAFEMIKDGRARLSAPRNKPGSKSDVNIKEVSAADAIIDKATTLMGDCKKSRGDLQAQIGALGPATKKRKL